MLDISCQCGALKGRLESPAWTNRAVCYCRSCQAFPARLGKAEETLDAQGGTDILQVPPGAVTFSQGDEELACLRITPKGPLRWYARCCNTPIGNSAGTPKLSFMGLIHTVLGGHAALDVAVGAPRAFVFTETALGEPKPEKVLPVGMLLSFAWWIGKARLTGAWRNHPLFDDQGKPVAVPAPPSDRSGNTG